MSLPLTTILRNLTMPIVKNAVVGSFFLLAAMILITYHEILSWVIRGWFTLNNAYSFIIFLLFLYMVWQKRDLLRHEPFRPNIPAGPVRMHHSHCRQSDQHSLAARHIVCNFFFRIDLDGPW